MREFEERDEAGDTRIEDLRYFLNDQSPEELFAFKADGMLWPYQETIGRRRAQGAYHHVAT
jgi:hypothetical protein